MVLRYHILLTYFLTSDCMSNLCRLLYTLQAYVTVCDALIVFSKNIGDKEPQKTLVYEPDKSLQNQLSSFLMDKVFIEDDDGK